MMTEEQRAIKADAEKKIKIFRQRIGELEGRIRAEERRVDESQPARDLPRKIRIKVKKSEDAF